MNHMQTMSRLLCSCGLSPMCHSSLKKCGKNGFVWKSVEKLEEGNWTSSSSIESNWHKGQEYACGGEGDGCPQVTLPLTCQPTALSLKTLSLQGTTTGQKSANFNLSYAPLDSRGANTSHGVNYMANKGTQKPNFMQIENL